MKICLGLVCLVSCLILLGAYFYGVYLVVIMLFDVNLLAGLCGVAFMCLFFSGVALTIMEKRNE